MMELALEVACLICSTVSMTDLIDQSLVEMVLVTAIGHIILINKVTMCTMKANSGDPSLGTIQAIFRQVLSRKLAHHNRLPQRSACISTLVALPILELHLLLHHSSGRTSPSQRRYWVLQIMVLVNKVATQSIHILSHSMQYPPFQAAK